MIRTLTALSLRAVPVAIATGFAAAQTVNLAARVDFGMAQENAQQSVCADFDRDGNLDIATTMEGHNQGKIEVLFGDGQSDFGTSSEVSSYVAWGLCAGDFDQDGWLDLAATSYGWAQHGVRIWLNDHNQGFTFGGTVSTLATPPVGVTAGDFDGDGILDLAAISEGGGAAVDWFHGNGNGTFSAFHYVPNTGGLVGRRIYAGHFNGDRHLDLVAIHSRGAMVLLNDAQGSGNFNASSGIPTTAALNSGAVADLDGDGRDDIVTCGANLEVWHGVGNGSFTLLQSQPGTSALSTELGDIDGDGRLDALLVGFGGIRIHFGSSDGTFSAGQVVPAGIYPKAGVIGDWNNDGWNDIAVACQNLANQSSYLSVYDQLPPAVTGTAMAFGAGCGSPTLSFVPDANARPVIGQNARATLLGCPSAVVGVMLGLSDQTFGAVPLPLALDVLGMPGCVLLSSAEFLGLPTAALTATSRSFTMSIPTSSVLVGAQVHLQAHAYAPGQNALELITSNGITWVFGTL